MRNVRDVLPIAFLVILWWVAVWGIVETAIQLVSKGNLMISLGLYGGLAVTILLFLLIRPEFCEHFV